MTKEVDLLSLTKSENSTSATSNNNSSNKKEGLSLFDSLLMNSTKESKTISEDGLTEKSTKNDSQQKTNQESVPNSSKDKTSETTKNQNQNDIKQEETPNNDKKEVSVKNNDLDVRKQIDNKQTDVSKNINSSDTKKSDISDSKTEIKTQSSATSLLDRMVLEAKKQVKTLKTESLEPEVKSDLKVNEGNVSKETEVKLDGKTISTNSELKDTKTTNPENNSNKIETLKTDGTSEVNKTKSQESIDNKTIINNGDKTTEKTVNSEIKQETNEIKESKTLFDRIISSEDKKISSTENKSIENSNVETKIDKSLNEEVSKNIKNDVSLDNSIKKESNPITLGESEVSTKQKELPSSENKDLKQEQQNVKVDVNIYTKKSSSEINDNKTVLTKEQVQTTMDFEGKNAETKPLTSETTEEVKSEIKVNNETLKNSIENGIKEGDLKPERKIEVSAEKVETVPTNKLDVKDTPEIKESELKPQTKVEVSAEKVETVPTNKLDVKDTPEIKESELKPQTKVEVPLGKVETVHSDKVESKELKNSIANENNIVNSKTTNIEETKTTVKNTEQTQTSSKDISKLDSKAIVNEEQRVNVSKDILKDSSEPKVEERLKSENLNSKSLMDRLLDNANKQTISTKSNTTNNQTLDTQVTNQKTNDIATNIFLSTQKNSIYAQMVANKSEGVKTVKDASSIEDVKKGAAVLDLGLEDASVEIEKQSKQLSSSQQKGLDSKISLIDKLAFDKNMNADELLKTSQNTTVSSSTTVATSSTSTEEAVVNLNVNQNLAMTIQNRIVGAQQHMSSMMSDVARNMYENYKPPITAFRLNLFPAQLGHIAILMKNDRENSISITMNMSQSSTLDAFVENQTALRDALNRSFNNNQTNFNLDFNMQGQDSNSSSFSQDQQNSNQNNQTHSSDEIVESIIQNQDVAEDINYM